MQNSRFVALDTETFYDFEICDNKPFIATTCERVKGQLKSKLYNLSDEKDFKALEKMLCDESITWVFHNAVYDIYVLSQVGLIFPCGLTVKPQQLVVATSNQQLAASDNQQLATSDNQQLAASDNQQLATSSQNTFDNQLGSWKLLSNVRRMHDTMLMSQILNENYKAHRLKTLAQVYLNETTDENEVLKVIKKELRKHKDYIDYRDIPKDVLYPYAIKDVEYTLRLFEMFVMKIGAYAEIYKVELSLVPVIVDVIQRGMKIDRVFVKEQIAACENSIRISNKNMHVELKKHSIAFEVEISRSTLRKNWQESFANHLQKHELSNPELLTFDENPLSKTFSKATFKCTEVFSPGSTSHIAHVIEALKIPSPALTSKDAIATNKTVLVEYASLHPFFQYLREFRFYTKQLGTYYEPFLNWYTNENNSYAHFPIWQSGAKTGRFSAELIQTMPRPTAHSNAVGERQIRKAFVPTEGYTLVCIDYEQIEMRLFAHFSRCKILIDAINAGKDVYLLTATRYFGQDVIDKAKAEAAAGGKKFAHRNILKVVCLSIMYGMGKKGLLDYLIDVHGNTLHIQDCYQLYDWLFQEYPEIRECINKYTTQIACNGFVQVKFNSENMQFHRAYHLSSRMSYKAINCVIQGTAAYVMKTAMLRVDKYVKQHKLLDKIRMIATIHDEIIFEVHNSLDLKETIILLQSLMEDTVTFRVPIVASAKASANSWGDAQAVA